MEDMASAPGMTRQLLEGYSSKHLEDVYTCLPPKNILTITQYNTTKMLTSISPCTYRANGKLACVSIKGEGFENPILNVSDIRMSPFPDDYRRMNSELKYDRYNARINDFAINKVYDPLNAKSVQGMQELKGIRVWIAWGSNPSNEWKNMLAAGKFPSFREYAHYLISLGDRALEQLDREFGLSREMVYTLPYNPNKVCTPIYLLDTGLASVEPNLPRGGPATAWAGGPFGAVLLTHQIEARLFVHELCHTVSKVPLSTRYWETHDESWIAESVAEMIGMHLARYRYYYEKANEIVYLQGDRKYDSFPFFLHLMHAFGPKILQKILTGLTTGPVQGEGILNRIAKSMGMSLTTVQDAYMESKGRMTPYKKPGGSGPKPSIVIPLPIINKVSEEERIKIMNTPGYSIRDFAWPSTTFYVSENGRPPTYIEVTAPGLRSIELNVIHVDQLLTYSFLNPNRNVSSMRLINNTPRELRHVYMGTTVTQAYGTLPYRSVDIPSITEATMGKHHTLCTNYKWWPHTDTTTRINMNATIRMENSIIIITFVDYQLSVRGKTQNTNTVMLFEKKEKQPDPQFYKGMTSWDVDPKALNLQNIKP